MACATPALLVNFYANVHERTEIRSVPGSPPASGYYGYRYGLYDPWPLYENGVRTVTYPVGTTNVDVVDAKKKQLVWEGIAEGQIADKDMDAPREAIFSAVSQVFSRYPGRASAVDAAGP